MSPLSRRAGRRELPNLAGPTRATSPPSALPCGTCPSAHLPARVPLPPVAGAARLVGGEQQSGDVASPLFGKGLCTVRDRSLHFVAHLGEANTIGDVPHVNNGV
jgi:hypothetical protein